MNIGGTAYNSKEIDDIEDILKVFMIGQRIGNLPINKKTGVSFRKTRKESLKKEVQSDPLLHGYLSNFTVKGLN